MKKIVLSVAAVLAVAAFAYAAPNTIVGSLHDLSSSGAGVAYTSSQAQGEICVYCHTPHNAYRSVPLWNRENPSPMSLYNSVTLSTEAKSATFEMDSISAFCMSCHDGSTKTGAIKNLPTPNASDTFGTGTGGKAITNYAGIGQASDQWGGFSLTNDHPIGFSYAIAATQDDAESKTGGLNDIATVKTKFGLTGSVSTYQPFFKSSGGDDQMECASCHKVHQPGTSGNFLRIENAGSALCLACHNK